MNESKSTVLVFDPTQTDLATAIKKEDESIIQLPIEINQAQKNPEKLGFATADDVVIAPERPALLLFTDSDTPAVLTRQTFYDQATGKAIATTEMTDATMLCILICLSSGPPPS